MFHSKGTWHPDFCGRSTECSCWPGCLSDASCFSEFHLNQEIHSLCGFSCHVQCREKLRALGNSFRMKPKENSLTGKIVEDDVAWEWFYSHTYGNWALSAWLAGGLNVIKLSANLPKCHSWRTAERNCSFGYNF